MKEKFRFLPTILFLVGLVAVVILSVAVVGIITNGGASFLRREAIVVIHIEGLIQSSKPTVELLERYGRDPSVKAIVLRIDTPGGAVGPTQEIYRAVRRLNRTKKIVASLGSIAASGGYYVACGAEKIVANPGTITGSIGVVAHFTNIEKLLEKLGIKGEVIKSGAYKDMGSPYRALTSKERRLIQSVIDDIYQQFVEAICEGRKMSQEQLAPLADGRIFSGRQAKKLGLVDYMGGLEDAIQIASGLAGIKGKPKVIEEPKKRFSLLRLILGKGAERFLDSTTQGLGLGTPFVGYLFEP